MKMLSKLLCRLFGCKEANVDIYQTLLYDDGRETFAFRCSSCGNKFYPDNQQDKEMLIKAEKLMEIKGTDEWVNPDLGTPEEPIVLSKNWKREK